MSPRAGGKPLVLTEKDEKRFWAQVSLPDENGCMRWRGHVRKDGYASFYLARRQVLRADTRGCCDRPREGQWMQVA